MWTKCEEYGTTEKTACLLAIEMYYNALKIHINSRLSTFPSTEKVYSSQFDSQFAGWVVTPGL